MLSSKQELGLTNTGKVFPKKVERPCGDLHIAELRSVRRPADRPAIFTHGNLENRRVQWSGLPSVMKHSEA